ncbi:patatin-like phospholipase family protein [Haloarchaeobius sp. TZWWS8]|uniref:patatin-like phospholipase family protein n=1 Tax=Haloarchaeobius sp. TZWWS8 TaxID=3446121 RepID=UPI003EB6BA7D
MSTNIAIACQGGGSHTAFTAGALRRIIADSPDEYEIGALSGTSGGGICALVAWAGLAAGEPEAARDNLEQFWMDVAADWPVESWLNDFTLTNTRLWSEFGSFGVSPYRNPVARPSQRQFRRTILDHCAVDGAYENPDPPALFIGAVDVESGEFGVFTNDESRAAEDPETFRTVGTPDEAATAALASAAVPTLFEAVSIGDRYYWDGLFSQNPPIRHFMASADVEEKPDEIWIVRINPKRMDRKRRTVPPRSMAEIMDRRNELSGNLSLEQEKDTIRTVNKLQGEDPEYKHIDVKEVFLQRDLDVHSKLDRDPAFLEDLMNRGSKRAPELWE